MIPKKILFCADFSENSERARRLAVAYANAFGAKLLILNVINTRVLRHPALVDLPVYDVALESVKDAAKASLLALGEKCRAEVADVTTHSEMGVPATEIVRFADQESVDLIIMGTQGRTGFTHLLLGSTAETVLRTAKAPVLAARSESA